MKFYNNQFITSQPMNVTSESLPQQLQTSFGYSIQAEYTGTTISGILKLQASDDPNPAINASELPVNWSDIADSSFVLSASGTTMWNVGQANYSWVRVVYTDSSGGTSDGLLTARITAKGF